LHVLDHVLVCFVLRVDARLRALYGERKRIHDHDGMPDDLSLHKPHDFPWYTRARMYDLKKRVPARSDQYARLRKEDGAIENAPFLSEQLPISYTA
jgi:hypothetical protein